MPKRILYAFRRPGDLAGVMYGSAPNMAALAAGMRRAGNGTCLHIVPERQPVRIRQVFRFTLEDVDAELIGADLDTSLVFEAVEAGMSFTMHSH